MFKCKKKKSLILSLYIYKEYNAFIGGLPNLDFSNNFIFSLFRFG